MEFKSNVSSEEGPGLISIGKNQNHGESGHSVGLERGARESELVLCL